MAQKPLSIEERMRILNIAVGSFRNIVHSLTDLANLQELYPEFMAEHYVLPHDLPGLLDHALVWREKAEANLTDRKILII